MNESTREGWTVVCVHGRMDRWIDGLDAFALTNDENPPIEKQSRNVVNVSYVCP